MSPHLFTLVVYALTVAHLITVNFLFILDTAAAHYRRRSIAFAFVLPFSLSPSSRLNRRILVYKHPGLASAKRGNRAPLYLSLSICVFWFRPTA